MHVQDLVAAIALLTIALIAVVFVLVIRQVDQPADEAARRQAAGTARKIQVGVFVVLLVVFFGGTWATLAQFPIPRQRGDLGARQVVEVTGRMWMWEIAPESIEAGSPVEFRVTSADVNHGFAIYGPDGRIVVQTQAMPEYTNKLLHTFDQPGTYTIQCLEFCGVGHAPMNATIEVVAPKGG